MGPARHPQYTGAHHDGKAVDGPKPPEVTRKPLRTPTWKRSPGCTYGQVDVRDRQCDDSAILLLRPWLRWDRMNRRGWTW